MSGGARRAVILVDHGSREPAANAVLDAMAELVRELLPGETVHAAHMELAAPSLTEMIDACVAEGAREIVVHPYFLAPGRHSKNDIPELARLAADRHPGVELRVTEPLGVHAGIAQAVVARLSGSGDRSRRG